MQNGHYVSFIDGYGGEPILKIDKTLIKNIESYSINGRAGELPRVTVTFVAKAVVDDIRLLKEQKDTKESVQKVGQKEDA